MGRSSREMARGAVVGVYLLLASIGACVVHGAAQPALATDSPPHVLFVVADDLGYNDLGHFNGGKTRTPAIDALIASGVCRCRIHPA